VGVVTQPLTELWTRLSVDLIPGADAHVEVDGGPAELPFLTIHGGTATVLVCVDDDGPTDADLVFADALAEQAARWRDRLRTMAARRRSHI
jgi:hypothetical protein